MVSAVITPNGLMLLARLGLVLAAACAGVSISMTTSMKRCFARRITAATIWAL